MAVAAAVLAIALVPTSSGAESAHTSAEREDPEIALENPALEMPIYWLGRTFTPGRGLPRLQLAQAFTTTEPFPEGGPSAGLLYTDHLSFNRAELVELYLWAPQQWRDYRAVKGLPFLMNCPKPKPIDSPAGRAIVYVGRQGNCRRSRGPKEYAAVVHFPGVVASVWREDTCEDCVTAYDPLYESFKGMAVIARGLVQRATAQPAPTSSATP